MVSSLNVLTMGVKEDVLVVGRWKTTVDHVDVSTHTFVDVLTLSPKQTVDARLATVLTQGHALRVNHTGVTQKCNGVYITARSDAAGGTSAPLLQVQPSIPTGYTSTRTTFRCPLYTAALSGRLP